MALKTIVVVPTYDERENIETLARDLLALGVSGLEVLVVDDMSPDGTGEAVERMSREEPRVRLLRRSGPAGRGLAGRDGFVRALEDGADRVVEMDGDYSHQPRHVPELLAALDHCDLVIGSRLAEGGSDDDRPAVRRLLTVAANAYARLLLGLSVQDTNSGFRAYTRRALEAVDPRTLRSVGPSIVHEVLFRAARAGLLIREVPIEFIDRKKGSSKLDLRRLAAGYFWILRLRLGL